jgi:hypothetical protein
MKRNEFKSILGQFLRKMMGDWFPDKPFIKGLGISLVDANINKYDSLIEMFEDEKGEIDIYGIIENIGDSLNEPFKIDLRQYSPLLPNRTLLITKEDLNELFANLTNG